MMYHNIIRRVPRPRGLGGIAHAASGMGAWVVDRPWGLSPSIVPGQPQPYQGMVRTQLPRSQHPRLLNVDYRVVAGGSWPRLLPANSPVFRTPVVAPGAQAVNEALPGDPVPSGTAGYGWVPLGVAHPPYFLAEKGPMSGYGQATDEMKMPDGSAVPEADAAWLRANPGKVKQAIKNSATIYAGLRAQRDLFIGLRSVLTTRYAADANRGPFGAASDKATGEATLAIFGMPGDTVLQASERKNAVYQRLQKMAGQTGTIDALAREAGAKSGPISVLSSNGAYDNQELAKSPAQTGFNFAVSGTVAVIAIVAAIAVGGTVAWNIRASFDEADVEAAKIRQEHLRVTRSAREHAAQALTAIMKELRATTDPTRRAQLQQDADEMRKTMLAVNAEVSGTWGAATETDWATWALLAGGAIGLWWILGKPFWKGGRTRMSEWSERRSAPSRPPGIST